MDNKVTISSVEMWEMTEAFASVVTNFNKWVCPETMSVSAEFSAGGLDFAITRNIFTTIAAIRSEYGDHFITLDVRSENYPCFLTEKEYFTMYDEMMPEKRAVKVEA